MAHLKSDEDARVAQRRCNRRGLMGLAWRLWYDSGEADYRTRRFLKGGPARRYSTARSSCSRCLREAPRALWDPADPAWAQSFDEPHLAGWKVVTDAKGGERMLCPACLTVSGSMGTSDGAGY
jgi:hypothetical protein